MIPPLEPEGDVYLAQLAMKLRALAASLDRTDKRDIVEELHGYADALDELAAEFPEMVNPIYLSPERRAEFQTDMTRIRREQLVALGTLPPAPGPTVSGLNGIGRPTAVFGRIWAVVVEAFNAVSRWWIAHVRQKIRE